jgi:hypothetical protein
MDTLNHLETEYTKGLARGAGIVVEMGLASANIMENTQKCQFMTDGLMVATQDYTNLKPPFQGFQMIPKSPLSGRN